MTKPRLKVIDPALAEVVGEKQGPAVPTVASLPPRLVVTKQKDGANGIDIDCVDKSIGWREIRASLGVDDLSTATLIIDQLANIAQVNGSVDEGTLNNLLRLVQGLHPSDHIEAMLAVQMAAVHGAMMVASRQLRGSETIPQQDSNANAVQKLARTFAAQVEALKRHRSGGHQKVTVEHVHVHEGGQAIVGNVTKNRSED